MLKLSDVKVGDNIFLVNGLCMKSYTVEEIVEPLTCWMKRYDCEFKVTHWDEGGRIGTLYLSHTFAERIMYGDKREALEVFLDQLIEKDNELSKKINENNDKIRTTRERIKAL